MLPGLLVTTPAHGGRHQFLPPLFKPLHDVRFIWRGQVAEVCPGNNASRPESHRTCRSLMTIEPSAGCVVDVPRRAIGAVAADANAKPKYSIMYCRGVVALPARGSVIATTAGRVSPLANRTRSGLRRQVAVRFETEGVILRHTDARGYAHCRLRRCSAPRSKFVHIFAERRVGRTAAVDRQPRCERARSRTGLPL